MPSGSPCQDVSGLNATGVGISGTTSGLVAELVRAVKILQKMKFDLYLMNENVASMSRADRDSFSKLMGVVPHRSCPSSMMPVRRPRFYWLTWRIPPGPGVRVEARGAYVQVDFVATPSTADQWEEPGWNFCGRPTTKLPTFVRAIKRKKPTLLAAGLVGTPKAARARWRRHDWRYPPYQYKKQFCLERAPQAGRHSKDAGLRPPNTRERERLMGLGANFIQFCVNQIEIKGGPRGTRTSGAG